MTLGPIGVLGTGLIGTSVGLALTARGIDVALADADAGRLGVALDRGAGRRLTDGERVDHLVLAVPPDAVAATLAAAQRAGRAGSYSDTASVKSRVVAEAAAAGCDLTTWCPAHPVAGRERSGPGAGQADLFEGRAWVLTPLSTTGAAAAATARAVAEACGATTYQLTPDEHDRALGLVSHTPQLIASLLAARLNGAADADVALAGAGLRDTTRIAASDPGLWAEIVGANVDPVREVLGALARDLDGLLAALDSPARARAAVEDVVRRGNAGRARLPGKHGVRPASYALVVVIVDDRPGRLGELFGAAAAAQVNVEDVEIEHAPGQPRGVVEISVRPEDVDRLVAALRAAGHAAHPG